MRLVVWNCADGFRRKAQALENLQADLAIIAECRYAALIIAGIDQQRMCWVGPKNGRGLAIISNGHWTLEPIPFNFADQWFIAAIARQGNFELRLLGMWVKPKEDYLAPTLRALDMCMAFLSSGPAIVAGDFNQNTRWDRIRAKRRFSDIITKLADLNIVSAWHTFQGEIHGQESVPTLYFRRSLTQTYHIDYSFLSKTELWKISAVQLGNYTDWVEKGLSDHVPLVVELDLNG